jgi:hypothetical protein
LTFELTAFFFITSLRGSLALPNVVVASFTILAKLGMTVFAWHCPFLDADLKTSLVPAIRAYPL